MAKDKGTGRLGILAAAVFLSLLTLMTPVKASAAYDCFIKIEGIDGESIDKPHERWIEVLTWNFGESSSARTAGGAGGAGRVQMRDFNFTMRTNKASPILFQNCANGKHMQSAILTVRKAVAGAASQADYLRITLSDVLVSSFVSTGNSKGTEPYPIEEVMLNFRKIRIEYLEIGPDGRARGAIAGEVESSPTAAK